MKIGTIPTHFGIVPPLLAEIDFHPQGTVGSS